VKLKRKRSSISKSFVKVEKFNSRFERAHTKLKNKSEISKKNLIICKHIKKLRKLLADLFARGS